MNGPDRLETFSDNLIPVVERTLQETTERGIQIAVDHSIGGFSMLTLRRMGHPYAHGRTPPADPGEINLQSGDFVRSWKDGPVNVGGADSFEQSIVNDSPHAQFLDTAQFLTGTKFMQARPVRERIISDLKPVLKATALAELRRALR